MGIAAKIIQAIDQLMAPPLCPCCELELPQDQQHPGCLCPDCDAKTERLPQHRCRFCGAPLNTSLDLCKECSDTPRPWTAGTCAFPYDGQAGEWIRSYKYGGKTAMAPLFIREMARAWRNHHGTARPTAVTPIPLHWIRMRTRGFNQAAILAKGLAKELGLQYLPALKRGHATEHQARLAETTRLQNLRKAFFVTQKDRVEGQSILVVDDVFTTGATFTAACQALLDAGAAETAILATARA